MPRDAFVTSLANFTMLHKKEKLTIKNVLCI